MLLTIFFNNFCNFGVFLSKKSKIYKKDCLKKLKIEDFLKRLENLFQISYKSFLQYEFYDFVNLFCHLQCFRPIFTVLVIFMFFNNVKNAFLLTPSRFQRLNISTKQNFLSGAMPYAQCPIRIIALRVRFGSKEANIVNFWPLNYTFGHLTMSI